MSIKLVAIDLDRTTLNAEGKISEANRQAILDAIAGGVHVCIASGRAYDTLPKDVVAIPGIEYAVTGNGAAVYRLDTAERMQAFLMTPESVEAVIRLTENDPVTYEAFVDGVAYASKEYIDNPVEYDATSRAVAYVQATRTMVPDIKVFLLENKNQLDCMDIIVNNENLKQELMERIAKERDDVYQTSSIQQLLEVSYKDAGKKSGVKFLTEYLGLKQEEVACMGDGDNDIDMIQYAGVGIAMENATDNLKAHADFITLHHDKDGLAYAFREILHII